MWDKLKYRKFLIGGISFLILLIDWIFKLNLPADTKAWLAGVVLAWLGVEGIVDFARAMRK